MTQRIRHIPRSAALLLVLLVLMVVSPSVPTDRSGFLFEVIFDLVLVTGVYSVGAGRHRWTFGTLTVVTVAVRWGEVLSGFPTLDVGALLITVVWIVYAVSIIIVHLFQRRDVTVDTILGAVVTYLLAAVAFMLVFEVIELQNPGSFSGLPDEGYENRTQLAASMMYFSLACITTMGYGDIVAVSSLARPLAVLEGMFGQLYLAVMIARLVGLHIVSDRRPND